MSSCRKVHHNTTKDNVTVTSSNISPNNGKIRILKILKSSPIFLIMKMTFNLNKVWHGVRKYQSEFVKKIYDNKIKDNVTLTSSNFNQTDGTIRILTHFLAKNHSNLQIADKICYCSVACITLRLTCAFQVIKLKNEKEL